MTIPSSIILPVDPQELSDELTKTYKKQAQAINGEQGEWEPTTEGADTKGTVTYTDQTGYFYRQGLLTDCWFSLTWTAHSGTGNLRVKLPYKIKLSADIWPGTIFTSTLTYTAGASISCLGLSDSFYIEIMESTNGGASAAIAVDVAAMITGHIRYIGQEGA